VCVASQLSSGFKLSERPELGGSLGSRITGGFPEFAIKSSVTHWQTPQLEDWAGAAARVLPRTSE
jgi:hypothetical protein